MKKPRRQHCQEFKLDAVALVVEDDHSCAAADHGALIGHWKYELEGHTVGAFPCNGVNNLGASINLTCIELIKMVEKI